MNLIDRNTTTFSVVPDELLGTGSFTYFAGSSLGGSIELLNGVTSDQLDEFEFTIWQNWTVITDSVDPNAHQIPPPDSSEAWIGFQLSASAGDTIPTFDDALAYYVSVRAVYKGEEYSTDRIPIEIGSAGTLTVGAYYRYQQDSGAPGVFDMSSLPATLGINTELWIDVDDVPTGDEAEVAISLNQAQIVWTVGGAEQTENVTLSAIGFGWDGDYHYYTGSVSGSVSVPAGATSAQLLCTVTASYDGKSGSDTAASDDYTLASSSSNPFGSGSFHYYEDDSYLSGYVALASGVDADDLENLSMELYQDGASDPIIVFEDGEFFFDSDRLNVDLEYETSSLSSSHSYQIRISADYNGGSYSRLFNVTFHAATPPTLEDSADAWFDSFYSSWDDDENYWSVEGKIYVFVDPDFSTSPTITLNGVTLNWNIGGSTTIPGTAFTGPSFEGDGYWYFEIADYDPGVPAGVESATVTGTVSVTVGSESVTVDITDGPDLSF